MGGYRPAEGHTRRDRRAVHHSYSRPQGHGAAKALSVAAFCSAVGAEVAGDRLAAVGADPVCRRLFRAAVGAEVPGYSLTALGAGPA